MLQTICMGDGDNLQVLRVLAYDEEWLGPASVKFLRWGCIYSTFCSLKTLLAGNLTVPWCFFCSRTGAHSPALVTTFQAFAYTVERDVEGVCSDCVGTSPA